MNTIKKALYIGFGATLFILGLGASIIFTLAGNLELSDKILAVGVSLGVTVFCWWLLRRGSDSVWGAISWLVVHLTP